MSKNESITITNPANGRKKEQTASVEELMRDTLYIIASHIQRELEQPEKYAVWPRKCGFVQSNGKNELVEATLTWDKCHDVSKSGRDGLDIELEDGTKKHFSFASDPVFYCDFGERYADDSVSSK